MKPYVTAQSLFPDRSARWVNEHCRKGDVPGAFRVGRTWYVGDAQSAALPPPKPGIPTVDEAYAELRRRGVL